MNPNIKKDVNKVVDTVDIEDITEKAAFCRCWRSKNVSFLSFYLLCCFAVKILDPIHK